MQGSLPSFFLLPPPPSYRPKMRVVKIPRDTSAYNRELALWPTWGTRMKCMLRWQQDMALGIHRDEVDTGGGYFMKVTYVQTYILPPTAEADILPDPHPPTLDIDQYDPYGREIAHSWGRKKPKFDPYSRIKRPVRIRQSQVERMRRARRARTQLPNWPQLSMTLYVLGNLMQSHAFALTLLPGTIPAANAPSTASVVSETESSAIAELDDCHSVHGSFSGGNLLTSSSDDGNTPFDPMRTIDLPYDIRAEPHEDSVNAQPSQSRVTFKYPVSPLEDPDFISRSSSKASSHTSLVLKGKKLLKLLSTACGLKA